MKKEKKSILNDDYILEKPRRIPVLVKTDVAVAGGGVAGIAAAVAAARNGAKTILIEANGFLGGTATAVPMNWFGAYVPALHKGIMKEFLDRLEKKNGIIQKFFNPVTNGWLIGFSVDRFKMLAAEMLEEAGAKLLLHAWIADAVVKDRALKGVIVESKSGREAVLAKIVIDATGDGDVAARAGCAYEIGRESDGQTQGMTLTGPIMEGVNTRKLWNFMRAYRRKHPDEILEFIDDRLPFFVASGFKSMLKNARKKGDLHFDYDTVWINGRLGTDKGEIDGSFVANVDGTNARDLTLAETESLKQLASLEAFARKYIPGFEKGKILDRRGWVSVGVRETRRITGDYLLTEEDVRRAKKFPDAIARNLAPIDIHAPEGQRFTTLKKAYDIPYRCLTPKGWENILVAGRCISVTHEALASTRYMPCCIAVGEAAGTAAALAAKSKTALRKVNVQRLKKTLKKQNAAT
ncbi:MAG: FAD-dependent oxidoreductase [Kiritimatiellae bacterium]|nr:FAD-dependent oxidoreductase [Kiritimatiellia bacterium]